MRVLSPSLHKSIPSIHTEIFVNGLYPIKWLIVLNIIERAFIDQRINQDIQVRLFNKRFPWRLYLTNRLLWTYESLTKVHASYLTLIYHRKNNNFCLMQNCCMTMLRYEL